MMHTLPTGEKCGWCGRVQSDPLTITVSGNDQSPDLCHDCVDAWDAGCRKFIDKVRLVIRR